VTTNARSLSVKPLRGELVIGQVALPLEGTAEAQPLAFLDDSEDWTYSATAEGNGGEVAVNGIDLDLEPGLVYAGPVGAHVDVVFSNIDVQADIGSVAPEAADQLTVGVFKNNHLVKAADEGWVAEFDTGTAEFNGSCVVGNLQTGDVVRLALMVHEGSEDSLVGHVSESGAFIIS
jgi:hypothetical protein